MRATTCSSGTAAAPRSRGETDALKSANLDLLGRLHPRYHDDVQRFIRDNPLAEAQVNVRYQLARRTRRRAPALLFVLHADPFADPRHEPVGGTQLHVLDLVHALAVPRAVLAWPDGAHLHAAEVADGAMEERVAHVFPRADGDTPATDDRFALADPARERAFAAMLDVLDVGAAHLHHLSGWPARIWRELAARGIPFAFTAHDYLCTCPSFYRLDLPTCTACACLEGAPGDAVRCSTSFLDACGLAPPADPLARIRAQRAEYGALLEAAAAVVAPSQAARDVIARALPGRVLRWHVIPHALPVAAPSGPAAGAAHEQTRDGALRVALLGAPAAPWKGSEAVLAVMRATRAAGIDWHVFGDADAYGFPARAAEALDDDAGARLHLHGRYVRDEIVGLVARAAIDVTLILSPWPETFSYTLSESWAAGVPAVVLDTGAPAARVRASGAGLVVSDAQQASAALERLARDPALLEALAAAARAAAAAEPSAEANAARHREAYGELLLRLEPRAGDPPWGPADRTLFLAHRAAIR